MKEKFGCRECHVGKPWRDGRCRKCFGRRAVAFDRQMTLHDWRMSMRVPDVKRFENCVLEIDKARGVITVSHQGKVRLRINRVPMEKCLRETIDFQEGRFL